MNLGNFYYQRISNYFSINFKSISNQFPIKNQILFQINFFQIYKSLCNQFTMIFQLFIQLFFFSISKSISYELTIN